MIVLNFQSFESVTILFVNFIGYTELCSTLTPREFIQKIDHTFSLCDALVAKYSVLKVGVFVFKEDAVVSHALSIKLMEGTK